MVSAGTGSIVDSVLFMILFGLGTMPLLLAISLLGNFVGIKIRNRINNFIPILMVIMGILFILRGLSLGIPFLSPPDDKLNKVLKKGQKTVQEYKAAHDSTANATPDTSKTMNMEDHKCH